MPPDGSAKTIATIHFAAMPQFANCTLGIVRIFRILVTIIIRFPNQPVKVVVGIGDGIIVAVGGGFQVAAGAGVVAGIVIIGVGREGSAADLGCGGLTPCVVGKVVILVLRCAVTEGLAVEGRQAAVGITVVNVGDSVSNALCWGKSEKVIVLHLFCEIKKEPTVF